MPIAILASLTVIAMRALFSECTDYRKLALAVIRAEVRALEDIRARHLGEPIESPKLLEPNGRVEELACSELS
jgi:hypothetical protein